MHFRKRYYTAHTKRGDSFTKKSYITDAHTQLTFTFILSAFLSLLFCDHHAHAHMLKMMRPSLYICNETCKKRSCGGTYGNDMRIYNARVDDSEHTLDITMKGIGMRTACVTCLRNNNNDNNNSMQFLLISSQNSHLAFHFPPSSFCTFAECTVVVVDVMCQIGWHTQEQCVAAFFADDDDDADYPNDIL